MDDRGARIRDLLSEVSETHHRVFRITDGSDDDWASWYADWLLKLSELPQLLGTTPVRSHLVCRLVTLDREYTSAARDEGWEPYYARALENEFSQERSATS